MSFVSKYTYMSFVFIYSFAGHFSCTYIVTPGTYVSYCVFYTSIVNYKSAVQYTYTSGTTYMYVKRTAYRIWRVIFPVSNLNRWSCSLGLFCHVPLSRNQWDSINRLEIETERHSKCNGLYTNIYRYIYIDIYTHVL